MLKQAITEHTMKGELFRIKWFCLKCRKPVVKTQGGNYRCTGRCTWKVRNPRSLGGHHGHARPVVIDA